MITLNYRITDISGVHARPATKVVSLCSKFQSSITLSVDKTSVNAKSIMGVLSLGISQGETLTITISGADEVEAAMELKQAISDLKVGREI